MTIHPWGGDPTLKVMLDETRCMLGSLDSTHSDTVACVDWLRAAESCLDRRCFGYFLPYHTYDQIWALLNRIRHLLCRHLPLERLMPVLIQVRDGLGYLPCEADRKEHFATLLDLEKNLIALVATPPTMTAATMSAADLRLHLERISRLVAGAREGHWRKVNMLRTRLMTTAFILVALLLSSIGLISTLADCACVQSRNLLAIAAFGALGGLVSALRTVESLETPASAYYVQRTMLCLRPVVGAAAGVVVYLVQISGIMVILADSACPTAAHLALAFVAGFSERFFVAQIETIAKSRDNVAEKENPSERKP